MACTWETAFSAPVCSGAREVHQAPSTVALRAGSVLDACGVSNAMVSVPKASCGSNTGAWAVSDREKNVTVAGVGQYYVYIPSELPAFVTMPLSTSAGRSSGAVLRIEVPNTAYAAAVVSFAKPTLLYETSVSGMAVTVRSNSTSDKIFAQSHLPNATFFISSSPPSPTPPGVYD